VKTDNALGLSLLVIVAVASVLYWGINNSSSRVNVHPAVDAHQSTAATSSTQKKVIANLLPQKPSVPRIEDPPKFKTQHQIYTAPGDVAKESDAEARAGLPEAMRQLGQALLACAHADMSSDEEIEQKIAKRSIGRELLKGDSSIPNVAYDAQEVDRLKRVRESCKLVTKDDMAQGLTWLERSAEAGDSEARAKYAWTALDEFPTYEAKEDNAEGYLRRRDLALGYLKDSIANGDCSNGILNGFRKATSDPVSNYVYQSLLYQHALQDYDSGKFPPDVAARESAGLEAMLAYMASTVPVDQRAAAENTTRDILQNYCTTF
jgi:hypothetical protein